MTRALTKLKCECCKAKFKRPARGRAPKYCSQSCRQRAYEKRKLQAEVAKEIPMRLVNYDLDTKFELETNGDTDFAEVWRPSIRTDATEEA
jgi:hypothetical protein